MSGWDWARRGLGLALGVVGVVGIARARAHEPKGPLPLAPPRASAPPRSRPPTDPRRKTLEWPYGSWIGWVSRATTRPSSPAPKAC